MAKYFSFDSVAMACRQLKSSGVSAAHLSALRYCLAFDAFVKRQGRDCDLKQKSPDRASFVELVNDIVGIDDGGMPGAPSYISDFNGSKPSKPKLSQQVSSNFFTANAVRQSRGKSNELYPSGVDKYLFKVTDESLDSSSINYGHISYYLPTIEARVAFAIWVSRYDEMSDDLLPIAALKDALEKRYSVNLASTLLDDADEDFSLFGLTDSEVFSDVKPLITWKLLYPGTNSENHTCVPGAPHNWIFFGAPGTGKSHELSKIAENSFLEPNVLRVTFYPDYTYSQFVGCFKPVAKNKKKENDGNQSPLSAQESYISYEFVPGPFLLTYMKAVQHPDESYLLIVEEINRANPAAVFGDVFQLLDRDDKGNSTYTVATSKEMADCIGMYFDELSDDEKAVIERYYDDVGFEDIREMSTENLSLPPNMYIWATMNSADQGVFPMDTAFKRRWDFRYIGIDEGENADIDGTPLSEIEVPCGGRNVLWNDLRHAINEFLMSDEMKVNEDKLLGPFFISPSALKSDRFSAVFKDKVLLYLYEDVGKTKRKKMFRDGLNTYSKVCAAFDVEGEGIFGAGFDGSHISCRDNGEVQSDITE